jgi:hypothetical protein
VKRKARIIDADTEDKRKEIATEFAAAEAELKEWDSQKRPALFRDFTSELRRIQSDALTAMEEFLGPERGKFARSAQREILNLTTAEEIAHQLPNVIDQLRAAASQFLLCQTEQLTKDVLRLAQALVVKANAEIASSALMFVKPGGAVVQTEMPLADFSQRIAGPTDFDYNRIVRGGWSMYGSTGAGIGATLGWILPFIGPVIGGVAGWVIGGIVGAKSALVDVSHKQRDSAMAYAFGAINDQCSTCFRVTRNEFTKAFDQVESKVSETLTAEVETTKSGFEARRREIGERGRATQQMLTLQRTDVQKQCAAIDSLRKRFTAIQQTLKDGV